MKGSKQMSINSKQKIKCPKCGELQEITVWHSITADDSQDLKEDLLAGKINFMHCPICGQSGVLETPLLYHDKAKRLMLSFSPCSDPVLKNQLFENIKSTSRESGELAGLEDYNLRFVAEYNSLLEKILIFDNSLHDKAVEVLKVLILMQEPEKAENRTAVFGKCSDGEIEFLIYDKKENACYTSKIPLESYRTVHEQLRQSGVKYKSFDWEIIDIDYGTRLLHGINNY